MIIIRKRIINPQRYLYALHPGDKFYIAVPLEEKEDYPRLQIYGLYPDALARIPIPHGAASRMNAKGKWKVLKDLPKEERFIEHDYHIVDWHGNDHYGTCWQSRWCYQRELIPPTELAFIIEDGVLYSPLLENIDSQFNFIKVAMNIALEMLGRCEVWTAERAPAILPVKQAEVPWEILSPGTKIQDDWGRYIDKIVEHRPKGQQTVIRRRHEHLWHMAPDFCVIGSQNFWGYVIYGFTKLNLFVFECNEVNNATYIFRGDWEAASRLTKTEVLSGHLHEARIYHSEGWYENTSKLITRFRKEVA